MPVKLENLTIRFDGRSALDDLSLEFGRGTTTAVVGSSGSGKSLMLKCAAGLLFAEEGKVLFEDTPIASMGETEYQRMQARTGFHFQDAALWANKSLGENLSLPLLAANPDLSEAVLKDKIAESFESVGLRLNPSLRPAAISMGQRKLVSFLRATITGPEILFLDDSLSYMDQTGSRQLIARIEKFKEAGVTIILATHDTAFSGRLADRVAVLDSGRVMAAGSYQEVMSSQDIALIPVLRDLV